MGLTAIGLVTLGELGHGNPTYSIGGDVTPAGFSSASFGGVMPWAQAMTLRELDANPDEKRTVDGITGVPVDLEFTGDLFAPLAGRYLMTGFHIDANKAATMDPLGVPFAFTGYFMGAYA